MLRRAHTFYLLRPYSRTLHPLSQTSRLVQRPLTMAKRKRSTVAMESGTPVEAMPPPMPPSKPNGVNKRNKSLPDPPPDRIPGAVDGEAAIRASPDDETNEPRPVTKKAKQTKKKNAASAIEDGDANATTVKASPATLTAKTEDAGEDPEGDVLEEADPEEIKEALGRPPPVNSDYLPLPWKGRLGYACLCTYLRYSNPPVFSSRTTRIASILEHRHPLTDPSQPEHATKNRPDRTKPADIRLGQEFVEKLCLANVRDMCKVIRWNERYGIKFLRLSSEAFPFASHAEYGYKLAPFAADALAEVGKVAAELGHRLTTHPGQFTQLGSPRKQVIDASIRDLEYHDEMLTLLKLPPQQDRDAIMVLHMGGMFGDKAATLDRFRENYARLSDSIKRRLVLENDDMCWSVHDLLPICKELNIPLVLDFHHHNIVFDAEKIREGSMDIIDLFPEIRQTWTRKGITQKMHYSEPTPAAITPRQRRKHNPRVATLPPCAPDMDLMIEAKDKEQAVFELMRTFKLPGYERFNDIIPYVRSDDNKVLDQKARRATPKKKKNGDAEAEADAISAANGEDARVADDEVGMGGPQGRVYWPPGMEEWLRPQKRVVKKKDEASADGAKAAPVKRKAVKDEDEDQQPNGIETPTPARTGKRSAKAPKDQENDEDAENALPETKRRSSVRGKATAAPTTAPKSSRGSSRAKSAKKNYNGDSS